MLGAKKVDSFCCFPACFALVMPDVAVRLFARLATGVFDKSLDGAVRELDGRLVRSPSTPTVLADLDPEFDLIQPVGLIELLMGVPADWPAIAGLAATMSIAAPHGDAYMGAVRQRVRSRLSVTCRNRPKPLPSSTSANAGLSQPDPPKRVSRLFRDFWCGGTLLFIRRRLLPVRSPDPFGRRKKGRKKAAACS